MPFLTGKEAAVSEIQNGTEKRPLECRTYTVNDIAVILGGNAARDTNGKQHPIIESMERDVRIARVGGQFLV